MEQQYDIAIVADVIVGHRLSYVRVLCEGALDCGMRVAVIVPPDAERSPEWAVHMSNISVRPGLFFVSGLAQKSLSELVRISHAGHLIFPDGDGWVRKTLVSRGVKRKSVTLLVMRPEAQTGGMVLRRLKSLIKRAARIGVRLRSQRVLTLTSALDKRASRWSVADPIEYRPGDATAQSIRRSWAAENPDVQFWFGVVGAISTRKNLDLVVSALVGLRRSSSVGLVVAGKSSLGSQEDERLRVMAVDGGLSVVSIERALNDAELDAIIGSLDCVVLAHSNEGSSGILGKAMVAGTRILASGAQSLRRDCQMIGQGAAWTRLTAADIQEGAAATIGSPNPVPSTDSTPENFCAAMLRDGVKKTRSGSGSRVNVFAR